MKSLRERKKSETRRRLAVAAVELLAEETVLLRRGRLAVLAHRGPDPLTAGPRAAEVLASFGAVSQGADGSLRLDGAGAVVLRPAAGR